MDNKQDMLTVIEHSYFTKTASKMLSDDQVTDLIDFISVNYLSGDIIQGTGGIRKIRYGHQTGKGKSGGARVIYFVVSDKGYVHLLDIFEKNMKENLTAAEKNTLKKLTTILKGKD